MPFNFVGKENKKCIHSKFQKSVVNTMTENLWVVKCYGLILQPMARTNHKFPVTALQISHATTEEFS